MAGELTIQLETGLTINAILNNGDRTKRWNGSAFVDISSIADADWATGDIPCTEQQTSDSTGTGFYVGDWPSTVTLDDDYLVTFFSGTPSPGDQAIGFQLISRVQAAAEEGVYGTSYIQIKTHLADWLGLTRNTEGEGSDWNTDESNRLDEVIRQGYWRFIYNSVLPNEKTAHRWSFMQPAGTLSTTASDYLYDLDDDFGAIIGDISYNNDEDIDRIIRQTNPGWIDRQLAINDAEGRPARFAIRPKAHDQTAEQVQELMFYPIPDDAYDLIYHYHARFAALSNTNRYPLGGQAHADTILQSCRDVATQFHRDADPALQKREHDVYFERLQASIEFDRRNSPAVLGYNNDGTRVVAIRHGTDFACSLDHNLGGGP